jgi:hypothetical protein
MSLEAENHLTNSNTFSWLKEINYEEREKIILIKKKKKSTHKKQQTSHIR